MGVMLFWQTKEVQALQALVVFCTLITIQPVMLAGCAIVCIAGCPFATVWCLLTQWQEVVSFWRAGRKRRFACIISRFGAASKQGAAEEHTQRAHGVSVPSWCGYKRAREEKFSPVSCSFIYVSLYLQSLNQKIVKKRKIRTKNRPVHDVSIG